MITITKPFQITTSDTDADSVKWSVVTSSPCVTVSPSTGEFTGLSSEISLELSFTTETCITNESITIQADSYLNDNKRCSSTQQFTFNNLCSGLSVTSGLSAISNNTFTFLAQTIGGTAPFTYDWTYDTNIFTGSSTSPSISLSLKDTTLPLFTDIFVRVTDANGCQSSHTFTHNFSLPLAYRKTDSLVCSDNLSASCTDAVSARRSIQLVADAFNGRTIDWTTLSFTSNTNDFCINHQGDGLVDVYAKSSRASGIANIGWTVADNYGLTSSEVNLSLIVPTCIDSDLILDFVDPVIRFQDVSPSTEVQVDLEELRLNPGTARVPDFDTFSFVAGTGQTLVSPTELTTANGSAILDNKKVKFTIGTKSIPVDIVQFDITDTIGEPMARAKIFLDHEPTTAPTTVADTLDVVAGSSNTVDLLSNDTGDIDKRTVRITTDFTKGSYSINEGVLSYVANDDVEGSDVGAYKVANPNGVLSAAANVTVTVINAGNDNTILHCVEGDTVDLVALLGATYTAGGAWAADAGNPSVISVASPTAISFSGANAGSYTFTYTVTSGSESDVATIVIDYANSSVTAFAGAIDGGNTKITQFFLNFGDSFDDTSSVIGEVYTDTTPSDPFSGSLLDTISPVSYDTVGKKWKFEYSYTYVVGEAYGIKFVGIDRCGNTITEEGTAFDVT